MIKVETPREVTSPELGTPFVGPEDDPVSTYYLSANRNKESIRLDLKSEAGQRRWRRLVAKADVLMENFRPGCSTGSASRSAGWPTSTRGSWCCRSAGSGTTVPRAAAPATTRSPRARAG